jgi:hypothetical protein
VPTYRSWHRDRPASRVARRYRGGNARDRSRSQRQCGPHLEGRPAVVRARGQAPQRGARPCTAPSGAQSTRLTVTDDACLCRDKRR